MFNERCFGQAMRKTGQNISHANAAAIGRIYTNDNEVQTEELTLLDIRQWDITRVSFCQSVFFGQWLNIRDIR